MRKRIVVDVICVLTLSVFSQLGGGVVAGEAATQVEFPAIKVDREAREVRVDAEFSSSHTSTSSILEFLVISGRKIKNIALQRSLELREQAKVEYASEWKTWTPELAAAQKLEAERLTKLMQQLEGVYQRAWSEMSKAQAGNPAELPQRRSELEVIEAKADEATAIAREAVEKARVMEAVTAPLPPEEAWDFPREYECVFVTTADPGNLLLSLLLIGLIPGPLKVKVPEQFNKDNSNRIEGTESQGEQQEFAPLVDILVEWTQEEQVVQAPVTDFLFNRETQMKMEPLPWAFTGSYSVTAEDGTRQLAANISNVAVAVFQDRSALLNLPYHTANPYWGKRLGLEISAETLPPYFQQETTIVQGHKRMTITVPKAHPVTLIFRPSTRKIEEIAAPQPMPPASGAPAQQP